MTDSLYVRFERNFGFGDETLWGGYDNEAQMLFVFTPTDNAPDESYGIRAFRNFLSEDFTSPFRRGQIVTITNLLGAVDVTEFKTKFYL